MITWILCPNLWGSRLFCTDNFDEVPRFLRELPRPKIQLRHEDFDQDEDVPELTEDPRDHEQEVKVAEAYSTDLCRYLEASIDHQSFTHLVLCAEGQFMKILLSKLGPKAKKCLIGTVEEDLYEVNETDLAGYIMDFKKKAA